MDPTDAPALERAQWRMQEINDAWAVLRNPARRAAYDAELLEQSAAVGAAGQARVARTISHVTEDMVAPTPMSAPPSPDDETPNGCGIFFAVMGVLTLGTIIIVIAAAVIMSASTPDSVEVRTRERFADGTCVLVTPADSADPPDAEPASTVGTEVSGADGGPVGGTAPGGGDDGAGRGEDGGAVDGVLTGPGANGAVVRVSEVPCAAGVIRSGKVLTRVKVPLSCRRGTMAIVLTEEKVSLCLEA